MPKENTPATSACTSENCQRNSIQSFGTAKALLVRAMHQKGYSDTLGRRLYSLKSMSATLTQPQAPPGSSTDRTRQPAPFSSVGAWVDSHAFLSLALLLAILLVTQLGYSLRIPLWHDEVFTWCISQASSLRALLHLTSTVDFNPPLSYLITRATYHLIGVGTLQTRLPEIIGFALAMVCLFLFVRRRAGNSFGILAAAILLSGKACEPAIDGRPYGLLFGFGSLALVAWQSAVMAQERGANSNSRMRSADLLLGFAIAAVLLTHIFGLFFWAAIVAAEGTRLIQSRRPVPSRIVALILPLAATFFYLPLFRSHAASSFAPAFQAHISTIFDFYFDRTKREIACLAASFAFLAILGGRAWIRPTRQLVFTSPEWVAITILLLAPVPLILNLARHHGAFFYRYGDVATLGLAIAFTTLVVSLTARASTPAVLVAIIFLAGSGREQYALKFALQGNIFRHSDPPMIPYRPETLTQPDLPIVINSGIVFMEMNNHEPAQRLNRTYYLTGGPIAIQYTHANIFEGIPQELESFHLQGRTQPYQAFLAQHPHFYLLASDHDYPEDWMLRKLKDDGAQLRLLGQLDNSYRDHNLYDVTLPAATH